MACRIWSQPKHRFPLPFAAMSPELFPTPEAAAMQGFPPAYCRVLAVEVNGNDGFVLLDTGPAEYRYLYGGTVERLAGGWCGGIDSNGAGVGWTLTDDHAEVGVVAACGEAPSPAAAAVRGMARRDQRGTRPEWSVLAHVVARGVSGQ